MRRKSTLFNELLKVGRASKLTDDRRLHTLTTLAIKKIRQITFVDLDLYSLYRCSLVWDGLNVKNHRAKICSPLSVSSASCAGSGTRFWLASRWGRGTRRSRSAERASGSGWSGTLSRVPSAACWWSWSGRCLALRPAERDVVGRGKHRHRSPASLWILRTHMTCKQFKPVADWTGPTGPPAMGRWAPAVSHLWGPVCL